MPPSSRPSLPPAPEPEGVRGGAGRTVVRALTPALALGVVLALAALTQRGPATAEVVSAEMRPEPTTDSTPWMPLDQATLARWREPYALRFRVHLGPADTGPALGLQLALRGASEVSWDGVPVGRNGRVGITARDEQPGLIDWVAMLPPTSTGPGKHVITIRASSHNVGFVASSADARVRVGPLPSLLAAQWRAWLAPAMALGGVIVAWLYLAAAVLTIRVRGIAHEGAASTPIPRGDVLILALGVVGMMLVLVEASRPLVGYTYDLHVVRLWMIRVLTAGVALLLPLSLAARFGGPLAISATRPNRAVVALVVMVLVITLFTPIFDLAAFLLHLLGLVVALVVLRTAATRRAARTADVDVRVREARHRDAALLLTALATLLVAPLAYLNGLHLIALAALMGTAPLAHARALHEAVADASVRAARLEAARQQISAALLRSSIHPHWLMNTLTALQELIERDPPRASELVERLADEFRLLRAVSERRTIPADEEVALCRAHLAIVALAREISLEMVVHGDAVLRDVVLPPGVLHTLVENGLTHGALAAASAEHPPAVFTLTATSENAMVRLELAVPMGRSRRATGPSGTGTSFIEASLEAVFPGRWTFTHGANGKAPHDCWLSVLTVPAVPTEATCAF